MNNRLSYLLAVCLLLLSAPWLAAQKGFTVTGVVTDAGGEPVTGVSVVCGANRQGTITKGDGTYSILAASKTAELEFSFLGMKTQTVRIDGRSRIDVVLEDDAETLENALVVGAYGVKQRREDMVGSAFQVNSTDLQFKPKARVDNLLEGLIPGMSIENSSDSGGTVRVKLPGRLRWMTVPASAEAAPEQLVVDRFNKTLDAQSRARNPLHIPMRLTASPHVWAVDLSGSPQLLAALRRAVGKRVKIRYSDPSLSFTTRVEVSEL